MTLRTVGPLAYSTRPSLSQVFLHAPFALEAQLGEFPNAVRDADRAWTVPVSDLLAASPRVNAPRVSSEQGQPVAVCTLAAPAHQPLAGAGEQGHACEGERALAARVVELERALAVAQTRADGAERLAAERAARIDDLQGALRMLETAPRPSGGPPRRR